MSMELVAWSAIGVFSALSITSIMMMVALSQKFDGRLDSVNARIDALGARVDSMAGLLQAHIERHAS